MRGQNGWAVASLLAMTWSSKHATKMVRSYRLRPCLTYHLTIREPASCVSVPQ